MSVEKNTTLRFYKIDFPKAWKVSGARIRGTCPLAHSQPSKDHRYTLSVLAQPSKDHRYMFSAHAGVFCDLAPPLHRPFWRGGFY